MADTVYVTVTVPPQRPAVEVFSSLEDALQTMRTTWGGLGAVTIEPGMEGGFTLYRCNHAGFLVGYVVQREIHREPTHL